MPDWLRLNPDPVERRVGAVFGVHWLVVLAFYLTWDGWLYEWRECGFAGPNQHFDLVLDDMRWHLGADGRVVYESLNNLHNILYLCYLAYLVGVLALLTGNRVLKQGCAGLFPLTVGAVVSTVFPLADHLYPLQWAYDSLHLSGIAVAMVILTRTDLEPRRSLPWLFGSWGVYYLSLLVCTKWPFWENPAGYFSLNQINAMPVTFYGLEFAVVVLLGYALAWTTARLQRLAGPRRVLGAVLPALVVAALVGVLLAVGLITLEDISTGTCG